jgi:hypothetical protein
MRAEHAAGGTPNSSVAGIRKPETEKIGTKAGNNYIPGPVYTPVFVERFEKLLKGHPDSQFVCELVQGLREGFNTGYQGPRRACTYKNLASANDSPHVIRKYLEEEIDNGRMDGPFSSPPFHNTLRCNPIGCVPKPEQKVGAQKTYRIIHHLSFPEDDSVNSHIPDELCKVQYITIDSAIEILQTLPVGAYQAKLDIKKAFRILPIHPTEYDLFGTYFEGAWYIDKHMQMGMASSPKLFSQFSSALAWIMVNKFGVDPLIFLLDDFYIASPTRKLCKKNLFLLMGAFEYLHIPIAMEKTDLGKTIKFLGFILDTELQQLRLPTDKLE